MKQFFHRCTIHSSLIAVLSLLGSCPLAFGQLQWSSYDSSGNLVTANVASGGDVNSGSVTFTIPANTQLSFVTKNFTPFSLAAASARRLVTFNVSVSAGLAGVNQRIMGWGLYNSAGTSGFADDVGYFGLWNGGGPYIETYDHDSGSADIFSGTHLGQGTVNTGTPSDGVTYTNQIQLVMNSAATGISLGTSSSSLANAGLAMNGPGVTHRVYTNPVNGPLGGVTSFDEFAFMFDNTTANPVTVTLSDISLGDSLVWDASGTSPTAPTDGSGNWSATNANWSSGSSQSDGVWSSGYNAIIGANNGAAGIITITDPSVTVSNVTFNAPGSGSYNITGSPLNLAGPSTITVADGVTATNSSQLTGSSFTKEGSGELVLNPSVDNTYTGLTVINNGKVTVAGSDSRIYIPGDLQVNTGGIFAYANAGTGGPILPSATLIVNGGTVDNYVNQKNFYINNVILANNGLLEDETGNSYLNATNLDVRSGNILYSRYRGAVNFVKSTAGTVLAIYRPNSSGSDGNIVTLNGGALIFQKDLNAANRLKTGSPLTLGGGTLMFTNGNSGISPSTENPSVAGTFLNPGASALVDANAGTAGGNISLGALNRSVGSTFDFSQSGMGTVTTANANNNGILGGWATYGEVDWLVGTTFAAYSGYQTSTDPTAWAATDNVSLSGDPSAAVSDGSSINSLRLAGASTVTLAGTLTLGSGGLLVTGSGANTIAGGTLEGPSGQDLVVIQNSTGDLTIGSTLADNGGATALTKSGPGKLILTGSNTMTGTNYLNGGALEVSDLARLASGPLVMNGGTLHFTGANASSTRAITFNGPGGNFDVDGPVTLTQSGAISGSGAAIGDLGGLTKIGNGTLVLRPTTAIAAPQWLARGRWLLMRPTLTIPPYLGLVPLRLMAPWRAVVLFRVR